MAATAITYPAADLGDFLGLEGSSPPELIGAVRRGLPCSTFERLQDALGVSAQTLAGPIGLPVRTLNKRKHDGRFLGEESDNLVRVARVASKTFGFSGEPAAARAWLEAPETALDGETPLSLLDTKVGAQEVLALLGRLEQAQPAFDEGDVQVCPVVHRRVCAVVEPHQRGRNKLLTDVGRVAGNAGELARHGRGEKIVL